MKLTFNKIAPFALGIGLVLFCLFYVKTCNEKHDENFIQTELISALKNKIAVDSIEGIEKEKRFNNRIISIKSEIRRDI